MEEFVCENTQCGKVITTFVGNPCIISGKIHTFCSFACRESSVLCGCLLPAAQEIYDILFPWVGKKCHRCWGVLTNTDAVFLDGNDYYHQECWEQGRQQLERAQEQVQKALAKTNFICI